MVLAIPAASGVHWIAYMSIIEYNIIYNIIESILSLNDYNICTILKIHHVYTKSSSIRSSFEDLFYTDISV